MSDQTKERPAGDDSSGAASNPARTFKLDSSLALTDAKVLARRREFGIRVFTVRRDGIVVAQVYSDLPAAERKVAATLARGLDARAELVRIVPVQPLDDGQVV